MAIAGPKRLADASRRIVLAIGATLAAGGPSMADDVLAVVTRSQDGFAGTSGTRTTLLVDGRFRVERFVGPRILELREGRITAERLDAARAAIDAAKLAELRPSDSAPSVNPQRITVEAAGVVRSQAAPAPASGHPADAMTGILADLARRIEELTRP